MNGRETLEEKARLGRGRAHTVELSYTPPGLIPALGLLALALAGGAVSLLLERRRGNKLSR